METDDHDGPHLYAGPDLYLSPYEIWNFETGIDYAFPIIRRYRKYISAFAELVPGKPSDTLDRLSARGLPPTLWAEYLHNRKPRFLPFVAVNPFSHRIQNRNELKTVLGAGLKQVLVELRSTPQVRVDILTIGQSRFRVALPVPDPAMHADLGGPPCPPHWQPDPGLRERIGSKRITVVAVIDDGIPFAHRNFRDASGCRTRVEFCWLQSVAVDKEQKSVLFGREYTRRQIEHYIEQFGGDEDRLYQEAGANAETDYFASLIERHATHGSHVMDLATGYAPERDEEPREEIRIIAVQLPNSVTVDTSGFGKDMYMLSAFHYIFDRADIIAKEYNVDNLRLVINFSYGYSGGRHDGETELEAAINELVELRRQCTGPTALVLPSGNTFLERMHGRIRETDFKDGAARLSWRIQPNDRTPSYLELWFGKQEDFCPRGYSVELWDPWDRLWSSLAMDSVSSSQGDDPEADQALHNPGNHHPVGQISVDLHRADAPNTTPKTGRWRVLIVMAPTEPEDGSLPGAESGKWTIVIKRREDSQRLTQPIHCWVQRADDPESLRSGARQSYFTDPDDVRYTQGGDLNQEDTDDAFIRRFDSLNGLATGCATLVVGGYRLGAGLGSPLKCARPALYSSAGTLEPGWPEKEVDCSSMSDRSRPLPGTIAAGVRSGSLSFVQGTSAAAPFVARQLATIFTTATNECVEQAEAENYRPLLCGYWQETEKDDARNGDAQCLKEDEKLVKARLGAVRVPPHWQPGIEPRDCADEHGGTQAK
jgi:hypothetical protein